MKVRVMVLAMVLVAAQVLAENNSSDNRWGGKNTYEGPVDLRSNVRIMGTEMTATATELNILDAGNMATGYLPVGAPSSQFSVMDDFVSFTYATNGNMTLGLPWAYTADAVSMATVTATMGGWLSLSTSGTSNDEAYIQLGGLKTEGSFGITSNGLKKLWYETNIKGPVISSNAANCAVFIGLAEAGSSAANFLVDSTGVPADKDYIGFVTKVADTNSYWSFVAHNTGATMQQITNVLALNSIGTAHRLGFSFDGVRTVTAYVDGTSVGSRTINDAVYPTASPMNPIIATKTMTTSVSPTSSVDYVFCNQER
jgi:hypothetical protein